MQFPVSSGQHHRLNESEWVPVEPTKPAKKDKEPTEMTANVPTTSLAVVPLSKKTAAPIVATSKSQKIDDVPLPTIGIHLIRPISNPF